MAFTVDIRASLVRLAIGKRGMAFTVDIRASWVR
jgi:hypothetical protein